MDGIIEAHTGWQPDDYVDQLGYHGAEIFNDHDKLVGLITVTDAEGLSVHVHSIGNDVTQFMPNCIEDAGNEHLQFVADEDIQRMARKCSVPVVTPLWSPEKNCLCTESQIRR